MCGFAAVFWMFLIFMINQVNSLTSVNTVKTMVLAAGIALGGYATIGVLSVIVHATNNRKQIYTDDIEWDSKN